MTDDALVEVARKYAAAWRTLQSAEQTIADAKEAAKVAAVTNLDTKKVLLDSVQPMCGSATKPSRRIFLVGGGQVVVVEWDQHNHMARVTLEKLQ